MTHRALELSVSAHQFRGGTPMRGVKSSALTGHSVGVLSTSRGALLISPGEWIVRIGTADAFVLWDAEFRARFEPIAPAPLKAVPPPPAPKPAEPTPTAPRVVTDADRRRLSREFSARSRGYSPDLELS